ncbi:hypothetical protein M8332_00960 [Fructilactobacillus ixorae]|uniref:Uncharacterized protein n=1 Tax=Fructilactobacillus ixorae TaxID=1750535 RepID=A0ABY5C3V2_9LACO|nr:hypothetical protein [Fructilactobacillus ixorae]USS93469.1 hypothetical protein M8332_00960 [Fructilactobacillus ixorae]
MERLFNPTIQLSKQFLDKNNLSFEDWIFNTMENPQGKFQINIYFVNNYTIDTNNPLLASQINWSVKSKYKDNFEFYFLEDDDYNVSNQLGLPIDISGKIIQ